MYTIYYLYRNEYHSKKCANLEVLRMMLRYLMQRNVQITEVQDENGNFMKVGEIFYDASF